MKLTKKLFSSGCLDHGKIRHCDQWEFGVTYTHRMHHVPPLMRARLRRVRPAESAVRRRSWIERLLFAHN